MAGRTVSNSSTDAAALPSRLSDRVRHMLLVREQQSGLNRQQFAKHIGMASSSYYDLINRQANLQMTTLSTIAENLGVSEWDLVGIPETALLPLPPLRHV